MRLPTYWRATTDSRGTAVSFEPVTERLYTASETLEILRDWLKMQGHELLEIEIPDDGE